MSQTFIWAGDAPFLPVKEYARRTGQTISAVQSDINRGHLPIRKKLKGRKVEINMVALAKEANQGDY